MMIAQENMEKNRRMRRMPWTMMEAWRMSLKTFMAINY
jgi:hypothetical protein